MEHLPVMYTEALQYLAIKDDGIYIDCTFGRGGHSQGILNLLGQNGLLVSLDRDAEAFNSERAQSMLLDQRFALKQSCFSQLKNIVENANMVGKIDGILMDLGVSSPQLDNPERGFSFLRDGPLDMRMDSNAGITAAQWLATVDEKHLVKILFEYGEERFARRIAGAILEKSETLSETVNQTIDNMIEVTLIGYEEKNDRYYERLRDNYYNIIRKINSIPNSQRLQTRSQKRSRNLQTRSKKGSKN